MQFLKNTVMIVDDNLLYRNTLAGIFETEMGLHTMQARDAKELLQLTRESAPELILYDIFSASKNFAATMRKIAEQCPASKVIVLSYETNRELTEHCTTCGAAAVFDKGMTDLDKIVSSLKEMLYKEDSLVTVETK